MENLDGRPESASNIDLVKRLDNWVKERTQGKEINVRQNVANAVITDIKHPVSSENVHPRVKKYRAYVDSGIATALGRLNALPMNEAGIVVKNENQKNSETGAKFSTRIRREEGAWISEEISSPDKIVISQAKIGDDGKLTMTLNFQDIRSEQLGANPKIIDATNFQTGTKVLFLNHAASLKIISWSGK